MDFAKWCVWFTDLLTHSFGIEFVNLPFVSNSLNHTTSKQPIQPFFNPIRHILFLEKECYV
jgi:hypothetical protein